MLQQHTLRRYFHHPLEQLGRKSTMHFRAQLTVLLNQPLKSLSPDEIEDAIGYVIVIGVNASDLATAARFAHDVALRPKRADGSYRSFDGIVDDAQIKRIEKTDWEPIIQQNAKRIDQEGVYYSTGLIFFGAEES
jgi:hypothetical protein